MYVIRTIKKRCREREREREGKRERKRKSERDTQNRLIISLCLSHLLSPSQLSFLPSPPSLSLSLSIHPSIFISLAFSLPLSPSIHQSIFSLAFSLPCRTDNSRYDGEFNDGKYNGHGVYQRADGMRYEGQFRDGQVREREREGGEGRKES